MRGYSSAHPLFDALPEQPAPGGIPCNSTVAPDDVPRLSDQHAAILAALQSGPKTGPELARIAIRYSARLQEIKAVHPWLKTSIGGGQWEYRLI